MSEEPEVWAIVELMGHVRVAGRLSEEEKFGAKLGRIDIPTYTKCVCPNADALSIDTPRVACCRCDGFGLVRGFVSQFFGGGSVYRITVVTEDVARHVAKSNTPTPVSPWDFPKQLTNRNAEANARDDFDGPDDTDKFGY